MAEVSIRLLRSKARPLFSEETIALGRKHGDSLGLPCQTDSECTGIAAPGAGCRLRLLTLWPSGAHSGWSRRQQSHSQAVRVYSQWTGSRTSYHQDNSHRNGPRGAQDSGSLLYKSRTGYYDLLEVTANATQSQIKAAYYKQSFRFHPDRNSGNEDAAKQFGLVTEAYHILGSVSLRKKYDRGLLSLEDVRSAKKPSGKSVSPSRKEAAAQRAASTASSTTPAKPMFDFDAFYQAHYGEQLARERFWKARREQIQKKKLEKAAGNKINKLGETSAILLIVSTTIILLSLR
ncbi:dnaJ homolog subfamily C member 30, mitochondrial [Anomaloglossus baeobatrachus]|uniref:dnaJ homolog subfamily C member 30, mitochondrial n=1 Tax=Anomaloglossus baeobatrachus TaxID=238106 RepID=UPI003F504614